LGPWERTLGPETETEEISDINGFWVLVVADFNLSETNPVVSTDDIADVDFEIVSIAADGLSFDLKRIFGVSDDEIAGLWLVGFGRVL
jgi:hypothetical protein